MSRVKHPTPWRVTKRVSPRGTQSLVILDSADEYVLLGGLGYFYEDLLARIVRAVNAYESPVARAERRVVKRLLRGARLGSPIGNLVATNTFSPAFRRDVDCLLAARERAKKERKR